MEADGPCTLSIDDNFSGLIDKLVLLSLWKEVVDGVVLCLLFVDNDDESICEDDGTVLRCNSNASVNADKGL